MGNRVSRHSNIKVVGTGSSAQHSLAVLIINLQTSFNSPHQISAVNLNLVDLLIDLYIHGNQLKY